MNSVKQTFGILIVALALFGAYSLVCPKKPVDNSVSDEFRAQLEEEGIFLNDPGGSGGKSALFDTLGGNVPGLPSPAQNGTGRPPSSGPPAIFGGSTPQSAVPARQYGQQNDADLDLTLHDNRHENLQFDLVSPSFDEIPAWEGEPAPVLPSTMLELPLLEVSPFDEPNLLSEFDAVPLFDVQAMPPAETFNSPFEETTITPRISEEALELFAVSPVLSIPVNETLDNSSAFTSVDSTTAILPNPMENPQPENAGSGAMDSYNQRAPVSAANGPPENVRPLPTVTEEAVMELAGRTAPVNVPTATDHSASPEIFSFSDPVTDFPTTDFPAIHFEEQPNTQSEFQTATNFSDFSDLNSIPNDFEPLSNFEAAQETSTPGFARSSQQGTVPAGTTDAQTASYRGLPSTQSIDPRVLSRETQGEPIGLAVSQPRNPISQNVSPRPEVLQRIAQIRSILNDENVEYRVGHQRITELYMSDLSFVERELVLPIADKCGWAAFFSSRSFDPYEWGRAIKPTDTLQSLAAVHRVSPELILKINRLEHPGQLIPGKENVKVPQGPFDATIFLDRKEMVITAHGLFACRFRIGVGDPDSIAEGVYHIETKFQDPAYLGEFGRIEPGDPRNPLGTHWIGLDQEIGIHGTNTPSCIGTDNAPVEGFSLDNRDVADVYDMLTPESQITITR